MFTFMIIGWIFWVVNAMIQGYFLHEYFFDIKNVYFDKREDVSFIFNFIVITTPTILIFWRINKKWLNKIPRTKNEESKL